MFEADAVRERPPPGPPTPSIEGGGATTCGEPFPREPARPPFVPETLGGGGTTAPLPPESPNKLSIFRTQVCRVGGGAITAAFGEIAECPADIPLASGGGATTEACKPPPARIPPFTSGGGATTEFSPVGRFVDRAVAPRGTEGGTGLAAPRFGRAIAVLRSGGTVRLPGRRASRATSSGF
jgi:hypothetical protein